MDPQRLVHMANQIAAFFKADPRADAVAATASHLRQFWDPRMRRDLGRWAAEDGSGLDPVARQAILRADAPGPAG